jgi:transcription initiation factor TFIID subunit 7
MALRHDVQSGANNLKEKLAIELQSDMRHGRVIYGGQVFNAKVYYCQCSALASCISAKYYYICNAAHVFVCKKLVDLPCIIESLKTTDNKSFYKTADICQVDSFFLKHSWFAFASFY